MARLALLAAQAVLDGEMTPDDAGDIYRSYYDGHLKRSKTQSPDSLKAQASKLRQILRLSDERPQLAEKLLARVQRLHEDHLSTRENLKPLYAAMADVAREQLKQNKLLTSAETLAIMAKPARTRAVIIDDDGLKIEKVGDGQFRVTLHDPQGHSAARLMSEDMLREFAVTVISCTDA